MRKRLVLLLITLYLFIPTSAFSTHFVDEFTSIFHSDAIIEVAVVTDKYGYPYDSFFIRSFKGDQGELEEIIRTFGISRKKTPKEAEQKRLMFFYKNGEQQFRTMDHIIDGKTPNSDNDLYKSYTDMVRFVSRYMERHLKDVPYNEKFIIKDEKVCSKLNKNSYFHYRYSKDIDVDQFSVGGNDNGFEGAFSPQINIRCMD